MRFLQFFSFSEKIVNFSFFEKNRKMLFFHFCDFSDFCENRSFCDFFLKEKKTEKMHFFRIFEKLHLSKISDFFFIFIEKSYKKPHFPNEFPRARSAKRQI